MTRWQVFKGKYQGYPEYTTRITGHYAGDMLLLEEVGELSPSCAEKLFSNIKVIPNTLYELNKDAVEKALGIEECTRDKDLLEEALKIISSGSSILIRMKPV